MNHGARVIQSPAAAIIHSGQYLSDCFAAVPSAKMATPDNHAFQLAVMLGKYPTTKGERNRAPPRSKVTTFVSSSPFQFFSISMTTSFSQSEAANEVLTPGT